MTISQLALLRAVEFLLNCSASVCFIEAGLALLRAVGFLLDLYLVLLQSALLRLGLFYKGQSDSYWIFLLQSATLRLNSPCWEQLNFCWICILFCSSLLYWDTVCLIEGESVDLRVLNICQQNHDILSHAISKNHLYAS